MNPRFLLRHGNWVRCSNDPGPGRTGCKHMIPVRIIACCMPLLTFKLFGPIPPTLLTSKVVRACPSYGGSLQCSTFLSGDAVLTGAAFVEGRLLVPSTQRDVCPTTGRANLFNGASRTIP